MSVTVHYSAARTEGIRIAASRMLAPKGLKRVFIGFEKMDLGLKAGGAFKNGTAGKQVGWMANRGEIAVTGCDFTSGNTARSD